MGKKFHIDDLKNPWLRRPALVAALFGAFLLLTIAFLWDILYAVVVAAVDSIQENIPHIKDMMQVVREVW